MANNQSTAQAVERHELDYEIEDVVSLSTNEQMKAVADDTRMDILNLLAERAATVTHLAAALSKPKGTVGYHAKVLEDAGLISVVRTGKVRAMTEKYYGRTGRTFVFATQQTTGDAMAFINDALRGIRQVDGERLPMFTSRSVRIPVDLAVEFSERIVEIAEEFMSLPRSGNTVFGMLAGVYPTDRPVFDDDVTEESR